MPTPAAYRVPAAVLRRAALRHAWAKARRLSACYLGRSLVADARAALAEGWALARRDEANGWLIVRPVAAPTPAPVPAPARAALLARIEDMENTDRLGVAGQRALAALRAELHFGGAA